MEEILSDALRVCVFVAGATVSGQSVHYLQNVKTGRVVKQRVAGLALLSVASMMTVASNLGEGFNTGLPVMLVAFCFAAVGLSKPRGGD